MRKIVITAAVALTLCTAAAAQAQTTVVSATSRVAFTPSVDHAALDAFGQPVVDHYEFVITAMNSAGALVFTKQLGKPAPDATNTIVVAIPEFGTITKGVLYTGIVAAVNVSGAGRSTPSTPFGTPLPLPVPGAPTGVQVRP